MNRPDYADDTRAHGRQLASILQRMEQGECTTRDADLLRAELASRTEQIEQLTKERTRVVRGQLMATRRTLDQLIAADARPVRGGVLCIIEGGQQS